MLCFHSHTHTTHQNLICWNSYISIQENAVENVICEMVAILFQPQCVNYFHFQEELNTVIIFTFYEPDFKDHRYTFENLTLLFP